MRCVRVHRWASLAVAVMLLGQGSTGWTAGPSEAPQALFEAGRAFLRGDTARRDPERALALFREAAELGHAGAMREIGNAYAAGAGGVRRDLREAMRWWERAAKRGDPVANFNLGRTLERGRGVPPDPERAVLHYRLAAAAGYAKAETNLGIMFLLGRGVQRDPAEALALFERAAASGEPVAQYNAGLMRARGLGGRADRQRARRLLEAAARQDDRNAQLALAQFLVAVAPDDEERLAEALYWYEVAARPGRPPLRTDAAARRARLQRRLGPDRAQGIAARAARLVPESDPPPRVPLPR